MKKIKEMLKNKKLVFVSLIVILIVGLTIIINNTKLFSNSRAAGVRPLDSVKLTDIIEVKDDNKDAINCNLDAGGDYTCHTTGDSIFVGLSSERIYHQ